VGLLLGASATTVTAQTFDHLRIDIVGDVIREPGGEQGNVRMSTGPVAIGQELPAMIQLPPNACGLNVSANQPIGLGAQVGWRIAVTPTRVMNDMVTFRYQWVRARDNGNESTSPGGNGEFTLARGAVVTLDSVPVTRAAGTAYACGLRSALLRVSVDVWPSQQDERRLVHTDLWLVDRAADGTERSQALAVRGLVNQPTPFYFDTIVDDGVALDLFGQLVARPDGNRLTLTVETRSRVVQNGRVSAVVPARVDNRDLFAPRQVTITLQLLSNEVGAIQLPRLSENDGGAFSDRTFSIRIRSRQIR
jgi:hypothetical protein